MNNFFILTTLMIALFLVVPDRVSAQAKRNNDVRALGLTVSMKEQIVAQMVKNAHNPKWFKECIDEAGGLEKIVDIQAVSLSNSDAKQYLLIGKHLCTYGARVPYHWIHENRDGKMRMLADFGAIDGVKVTSHRTKGYRDLLIVGVVGAEVCSITFKFDGRRYQNMNNIDCKAREDIAEEKSGSPASARGQTIPKKFQGTWDGVEGKVNRCKYGLDSDSRFTVASSTITYYEARCKLRKVGTSNHNTFTGSFDCEGENQQWSQEISLTLDGVKLFHKGLGTGISRNSRCN